MQDKKSPKHLSIVVYLRPHFLRIFDIVHLLATEQRGEGKLNENIGEETLKFRHKVVVHVRQNTRDGYPAVNVINNC
jgi:hypothetical protein